MHRRGWSNSLSLGLLVAAVGVSGTVAAASEEGGALAEIVVTAQKRSERLQDVPITVTAISGAELERSGISSLLSLVTLTPNLQTSSSVDFVAPYIRGIGTAFANPGLDPSVAVYLDDQYFPRASAGLFEFVDTDHIEVLKGPQGTLYGRNTVGGAVRIITSDPSQKFAIKAAYTAGSYSRHKADFVLNGGLTPTLSGRVAFSYDTDHGYIRSVTPGNPDLADRRQYQIFAKLLWEPNDRLKAKLSFDLFDKRDFEGEAFLPIINRAPENTGIALGATPSPCFYCTNNDFLSSPATKSHDATSGASFRVDYAFDSLTVSSISGWRHVSGVSRADLDTGNLPLFVAASPINTTNLFTQEIQAVSTGKGPWKYTGGLYWLHAREEYFNGAAGSFVGLPTSGCQLSTACVWLGGDGLVSVDSVAAYGEVTYSFSDKLDLTFGGRYTHEKKTLWSNFLNVYVASDFGATPQSFISSTLVDGGKSVSYNPFTPKVTLSYKPRDQIMFYGTLSRGFKSGGFNLPAFGPVDVVSPEKIDALEIGFKSEFNHVRLNAAAFGYKQRDLQVQFTDVATGGTHVVNAAKTTIYGLETDLEWAATDRLNLGFGTGMLHTKFNNFDSGAYVPSSSLPACATSGGAACLGYTLVSQNFDGKKLSFAPSFTGYARAAYKQPLPQNWGALNISVTANYSSEFSYNTEASLISPSKTLANASLNWTSADDHYNVSVFGTNLTDKEYTASQTRQAFGGWYTPGRPREYGVTFMVRY